jgi:hypothetical protein
MGEPSAYLLDDNNTVAWVLAARRGNQGEALLVFEDARGHEIASLARRSQDLGDKYFPLFRVIDRDGQPNDSKVQRLTTTRESSEFARLGDLVQTIERSTELGIFYPIENPMNCSNCEVDPKNWALA